LFGLFEKKIQSLILIRKHRLKRQKSLYNTFNAEGNFCVDQSSMQFVP
jgi:hypothetical protein